MGSIFGVSALDLNTNMPASHKAWTSVRDWVDNQADESPFAKYVVAEIAFVGMTILSAVQTIASAIYALAIKGISLVLKDSRFEGEFVIPTKSYAINSFIFTNIAALSIIENLKGNTLGTRPVDKVLEFYERLC